VRAASKNFFIGLIARVFKPGCQLDTMVVFEGAQGIRKTSALRLLGGEWYGQANESVQQKDFLASLAGKWIVEIGELDAFSRAEVTRVKTVISTPVDRYRPSYGRVAADYPRQCVFVGTTNKDDWGNDETGLRRFWPMRCGIINLETLTSSRDQLFAEAVLRYDEGVHWWEMPGASTVGVQATRQGDHVWEALILSDLSDAYECTTLDLLTRVLKFVPREIKRIDELTVGSILRRAGWVKKPARRNGRLAKVWFAPEEGT
jgi:putative DNA primase/helicase